VVERVTREFLKCDDAIPDPEKDAHFAVVDWKAHSAAGRVVRYAEEEAAASAVESRARPLGRRVGEVGHPRATVERQEDS
jgi:hypothetical protein